MKIGDIQLQSPLLLAPMAGITDLPFRNLCRRFGASLAFSEMISADTSLWASRKTQTRLQREGEKPPIAVQILGTDPEKMARAAKMNVDHGAQIIDINMGCPAKKVCKVAAGSALLRDERLVAEILEAVVAAVEVPVTLKIRTGWDPSSRNALSIARIAEQSGVRMLSIHGRTRACRFSGEAEYETIRLVKQSVSIPIVANGDIHDEKKAQQVLKFTGADAIMIGRAAQGRPWIFQQLAHYLARGERLATPSPQWIGNLLQEHLDALYSLYGSRHGVRIARKHIAWYSRQMRGAAEFRQEINRVESPRDQLDLVKRYFVDRGKGDKAA
ncbi:tRNA dihydrouridine synthase DusB [Thiolapillus brandeum]|uniref:tRNA-dihydrouridine synthase B n=1 Tax=Thiolapillus brandeum TaxID=1076588 RepID=A0A7U6JGL4_9GAMM|nr:tRNA dihydrouridine synthase DusB [Thiolapillus brandeum]BAO43027.1 tRNA-dihydrouridine synthase B [Thiolapillus brandeum]